MQRELPEVQTYHSLDLDLPTVEVRNRTGEAVHLSERPNNLYVPVRDLSVQIHSFVEEQPQTLISSPKILEGGQ